MVSSKQRLLEQLAKLRRNYSGWFVENAVVSNQQFCRIEPEGPRKLIFSSLQNDFIDSAPILVIEASRRIALNAGYQLIDLEVEITDNGLVGTFNLYCPQRCDFILERGVKYDYYDIYDRAVAATECILMGVAGG